jgi:hypothetical protein
MREREVRNWLGIYFLFVTILLGGYIILFAETKLLPMSKAEAMNAFKIIIPVFVGQLAIIFQWFSRHDAASSEAILSIPPWVVKAPLILVACLLIAGIVIMIIGNSGSQTTQPAWSPSPERFKDLVTFAVTVLNATSVYIVMRFFKETQHGRESGPT